jgi:dipeptidyl aminopeptidase/acylaminoacyl peptidase
MKISLLIIILSFLISFKISNSEILGTSNYNQEIKKSDNFIAYIHSPNPKNIRPMRQQEIFLVNSETGKQVQLTKDNYKDSDLSWSPDGNKLLICSHRLEDRIAQQHDNRNKGFLFIYNFQTGKEISLENNISYEVDRRGEKYKNEGFKVEKNKFYESDSESPFWISDNRIGFKRYIYYGTSYGYGELCATDTFGTNLVFIRDIFEKRKCKINRSYWLNSDSIIVECSSFVGFEPSEFKLFISSKNEYVNYLPGSYYPISISHDKTKLVCFTNNSYVLYNLYSGEVEILFDDSKSISDIVLSPLNNKIAFVKANNHEKEIFVKDLNSEEIKQLTFDGGQKYSLSWSPKRAL